VPGAGSSSLCSLPAGICDQLPRTPPNVLYWLLAGPFRLRTNLKGMRATLERIKAVAERAG
jgi:hypothetical protein